jgi:urease accessory protein
MAATAALLLLADGRFPAGGHAHSGGLEEAVTAGRVGDMATVAAFLAGRLATAGLVAAGLAAAACTGAHGWADLDAEADARTASSALRASSRRQGRHLLRAGSTAWPDPLLASLAATAPDGPHHPVAVGAVARAAGLQPADAARVAAYGAAVGPASAAVRLLSLDPLAVGTLLADLAPAMDAVTADAVQAAGGPLVELPCPAAPLLDIGAEWHATREVRLFAS